MSPWNTFPRYWPFVRRIHCSPAVLLTKSPLYRYFMLPLKLSKTNCETKQSSCRLLWEATAIMWPECNHVPGPQLYLLITCRHNPEQNPPPVTSVSWWRHQMETFSAWLALCAGNSPVPGEFPAQRPATRSFDVFFDLRLNKRLSKQSWGWWFEMPLPSYDILPF